jgi:hypothetical protein
MSHTPAHTAESNQPSTNKKTEPAKSKGVFLLGALSGIAAAVVAPLFTKQLRPVVRGAIKGGIVTGRYVQKVAEGVVEDFQDITAEAKADIAKDETPKA